jgi:hypothetical protein
LLSRRDSALGFSETSPAFGGQLDQVASAVTRIAGADDQSVSFERVE